MDDLPTAGYPGGKRRKHRAARANIPPPPARPGPYAAWMADDDLLGLFPLDLVLMPGEARALHIFEPQYRQLFADCVLAARPFVMVREHGGVRSRTGCAAEFEQLVQRMEDGRLAVIVRGLHPVGVGEPGGDHLYDAAACHRLEDDAVDVDPDRAEAARAAFREVARLATGTESEPEITEGVPLSYALAGAVELPGDVLQDLLETRDENVRLERTTEALEATVEAVRRAKEGQARASTNGKVPHT